MTSRAEVKGRPIRVNNWWLDSKQCICVKSGSGLQKTAPVVKTNGALVTCEGGRAYVLGAVHPKLRERLPPTFDANNPLQDPVTLLCAWAQTKGRGDGGGTGSTDGGTMGGEGAAGKRMLGDRSETRGAHPASYYRLRSSDVSKYQRGAVYQSSGAEPSVVFAIDTQHSCIVVRGAGGLSEQQVRDFVVQPQEIQPHEQQLYSLGQHTLVQGNEVLIVAVDVELGLIFFQPADNAPIAAQLMSTKAPSAAGTPGRPAPQETAPVRSMSPTYSRSPPPGLGQQLALPQSQSQSQSQSATPPSHPDISVQKVLLSRRAVLVDRSCTSADDGNTLMTDSNGRNGVQWSEGWRGLEQIQGNDGMDIDADLKIPLPRNARVMSADAFTGLAVRKLHSLAVEDLSVKVVGPPSPHARDPVVQLAERIIFQVCSPSYEAPDFGTGVATTEHGATLTLAGPFVLATPDEVCAVCGLATQLMADERTCVEVAAPAKIFGDIHGQLGDLLGFFGRFSTPTHRTGDINLVSYVFCGDYVDRGPWGLEVIVLLLCLKVRYAHRIFLIRGNHEDREVNRFMGFEDECRYRINDQSDQYHAHSPAWQRVFEALHGCFDMMPLAARVERRVLCLHGGIGESLETVEQINEIHRPLRDPQEHQLALDILWSDPTQSDGILGVHANDRGGNTTVYGPDRVEEFCARNDLDLIVRAHECVMNGFEYFANGRLITIFSATNYCGQYNNDGAMLEVSRELQVFCKVIRAAPLELDPLHEETEGQDAPSAPTDNVVSQPPVPVPMFPGGSSPAAGSCWANDRCATPPRGKRGSS